MITKSSFVRKSIFERVFSFRHYQINTGTCSFNTHLISYEVNKILAIYDKRKNDRIEGSTLKPPSTTLMSYSFE